MILSPTFPGIHNFSGWLITQLASGGDISHWQTPSQSKMRIYHITEITQHQTGLIQGLGLYHQGAISQPLSLSPSLSSAFPPRCLHTQNQPSE